MKNIRLDLGKTPLIRVDACHSDLVIRSWTELDVYLKGKEFETTDLEGGVAISSPQELRLMVPIGSNLAIENVSGDLIIKNVSGDISLGDIHGDAILVGLDHAKIRTVHSDLSAKNLEGSVSAETVHGDAVLRSVGDINIDTVHGDFSARFVNGSVNLNEVAGDIGVKTVNGDFAVKKGHRDANLRNLGGIATVSHTAGDIRLLGGLISGDHSFTADGDIIVRWPADADINLTATASKIMNRIHLNPLKEDEGMLVAARGDGKTNVELKANGRIILKDARVVRGEWESEGGEGIDFDFAFDFGGLSEEFATKINEHVSNLSANLEAKFGPDFQERINDQVTRITAEIEHKFGPEFGERMAEKAEKAAAKAEKAAERAIIRVEKQMKRQAKRQQRPSRHRRSATPPTPPKKKSTPEEQLRILKMVENGVITPDEAATLLKALER